MGLSGKQIVYNTLFETPGRFTYTVVGSVSANAGASFGVGGLTLNRGTTGTGKGHCFDNLAYNNYAVYNNNPEFSCTVSMSWTAANTWDSYVIAGNLGDTAVDYGNTVHFGFRFYNNNGTAQVYSTCSAGDGSDTFTQTLLTLTAGSLADDNTYYAKMISGVGIEYYINGTLATTTTTTLPTAVNGTAQPFGAAIFGTSGTTNDSINVLQANFQFDM